MTDPQYFRDMYATSSDPWQLAERVYERRKYDVTVASLPRERYASAFEPGCSVGLLTQRLADRCDAVLATDPSADLTVARNHAPSPAVTFATRAVPQEWPEQTFDLIVVSELLYFLSAHDRAEVLRLSLDTLRSGGHLVYVHWRHPFDVAVCTGDDAHAEAAEHPDVATLVSHVEDDFRLEVFARAQV